PARARVALAVGAIVLAAAVAGLSWWALAGGDDAGADGPPIALAPVGTTDPAARGEAHTARDGEALALSVSGLPASAPQTFYELWLLDGPERLLSLGSFRVPDSGDASVEVPLPVPLADFAFIDVSREPADGDPGHSGDSLLRGASS
ncbi:MAG: anti-sigma factor, partial [Thermoleophilia bacterium]